GAVAGDTVLVAAGTYAEAVKSSRPGVTLRARGAVVVTPPAGASGIAIEHALSRVEGFTVQGGLHGIRAEGAPGTLIRGCTTRGQSGNGIFVVQSDGVTIDDNRVADAGGQGIVVKRAGQAYVRNNLVTRAGDWGIQVDNGDTPLPPVTGGHVLAFNTVYGCGRTAPASGGVRLQNATGEIRDNVVAANVGSGVKTDSVPTVVHHNAVSGSVARFDTKSGAEPYLWANVVVDPQLGDPSRDDFTLRQTAAGEATTSPAVDAGSGSVGERDIAGSTRSDRVADSGVADIGWHAAAGASGPRPSPVPTPSATPVPAAGSGVTFHVDGASGDDARNALDAQSPGSPWKTVARAIASADPGDVIVLAPGTYAEAVQITRDALTLRGAGAPGDVVLAPPGDAPGIYVNGKRGVVLESLVVQGGAQGVVGNGANGIVLRRLVVTGPATNGVQLTASSGATIDSCTVTGAGTQGILLRQSGGAYVRNNLVYANAEWGLSFDNLGSPLPAPVTGNVVAFNTVHANRSGIRMLNASGEVRDNQITEQGDLGLYLAGPDLLAHHNNFSANVRDRDQESAYQATIRIWATLGANPRYVRPAGADGVLGGAGWRDDDFRLRQLDGQTPASTMVDAGSGLASALDISGSTRTDGVADTGVADVGVHRDALPSTTPPAFATPPSGTQWTYYVSASDGSNARSRATARSRTTPWQTIAYALGQVSSGDTVVVLPGTYAESVQVQKANVTLIAETPGSVTIVAPSAATANGIAVERSGVTIDGFVVQGATNNGISVLAGSSRVAIRGCAVIGSVAEGIRVASTDDVLVQDSVVASSGGSGILLRQVTNAIVRNNLVYDSFEWGISIDNSTGSGVATGHLVERNTSAFNGLGALRLASARGTVRDNVLSDTGGVGLRIDTTGSTLLGNAFDATARDVDPDRYLAESCTGCTGNLRRAVRYRLPAGVDGVRGGAGWRDDDFRLAQTAAGDALQSEAVDAGSDDAAVLGATGTTAADGRADTGRVDIGFHYASSSRAIAPLVPPSGATSSVRGEAGVTAAVAAVSYVGDERASTGGGALVADTSLESAAARTPGAADGTPFVLAPAATQTPTPRPTSTAGVQPTPRPSSTPHAQPTPSPSMTPAEQGTEPDLEDARDRTTWFVDATSGDDART
ncbi:right-handed parallel beta-helix repeat-containing protein, partial [Candidatus Binatia bacterium]|nr:right-handed parallel beta-helix repeat-containing protein [Candidatus Binatia bacterium]